MAPKGQAHNQDERKQFRVTCDGCSFERTADGRNAATRIGNDHQRETGHELVAVEVPPSVAST